MRGGHALIRRAETRAQVTRLGLACAVAALLALAMASAQVEPATAANDGELLSILVMGDSYSAGNGAGSYFGAAGCYRSSRNYARMFERYVETGPPYQRGFVENVACSGDTTREFWYSKHRRQPQMNAVNAGYDIIFLTIGGNDLSFEAIVSKCLVGGRQDGKDCDKLLSSAEGKLRDGSLKRDVRGVLRGIRARADPRARIVLLGYPHLEHNPNFTISSGRGRGKIRVQVGKRLRGIVDEGARLQQRLEREVNLEAASLARIVYADVRKLFAGPPSHELSAGEAINKHRWLVSTRDASHATYKTWYHPNPEGWMEEALLLYRDARVPKRDLNSDAAAPPPGPAPAPPPAPEPGPGSGPACAAGELTVSGRVTDETSGAGVSNVIVSLADEGGNHMSGYSTFPDIDGRFAFCSIAPGTRFKISAGVLAGGDASRHSGCVPGFAYAYRGEWYDNQPVYPYATLFTIESSNIVGIDMPLARAAAC